jgi:hypothetical protein
MAHVEGGTVKERGIIFQSWGVNAIRNMKPGVWPAEAIDPSKPIKWQTRRVVRPQPFMPDPTRWCWEPKKSLSVGWPSLKTIRAAGDPGRYERELATTSLEDYCPYGVPGDVLWVRETHAIGPLPGKPYHVSPSPETHHVIYRADMEPAFEPSWKWRPSIHMPRWASREDLVVKEVRVERVQAITLHDIQAEGIPYRGDREQLCKAFPALWNKINAKRGFGWDANPCLWVVSYMRKGK